MKGGCIDKYTIHYLSYKLKMKIIFKNLGPIKNGEFYLQDFTNLNIIVGPNNSGKTYFTYLIYTIYKVISNKFFFKRISKPKRKLVYEEKMWIMDEDYKEIISNYISSLENTIKRELPFIFHTKDNFFEEFEIKIILDEEEKKLREFEDTLRVYSIDQKGIIEITKEKNTLKTSFYPIEKEINLIHFSSINFKKFYKENNLNFITIEKIDTINSVLNHIVENFIFRVVNIVSFPAERSGVLLFYKQLLQERSDILREIEIGKRKNNALIEISRYSEPVNEYIKFLNFSEEFQTFKEGDIYKCISKKIQKIIGGEVEIQEREIIYKCNNKELNIELVSSTVKSLAGFFLYLKYKAKKGDIVIIDEPELNLHPENQRRIFRLFSFLSKKGISFILSTHSPILINEANNMLLFQDLKDNKIDTKSEEEEYGLDKDYGLKKENINIWFLNRGEMKLIEKEEVQFNIDTFDEVMGEMYNLNNDLLFKGE
jgi:hypothetical protein fuD12_00365